MQSYAEKRISQTVSYLLESRQKIDRDISVLSKRVNCAYKTVADVKNSDSDVLQQKKSILGKLKLCTRRWQELEEQSDILSRHASRTLHDAIAARHGAFGPSDSMEDESVDYIHGGLYLLSHITRNVIPCTLEGSCDKCHTSAKNVFIDDKCIDPLIQQSKCLCMGRMHSWCSGCLYGYCIDEWINVLGQEDTLDDMTCVVRCPSCNGALCPYNMRLCVEPVEVFSTEKKQDLPNDTSNLATKSMQELIYETLTSAQSELVHISNHMLSASPLPIKTSSITSQSERKKTKRRCLHCLGSDPNPHGKRHYAKTCPYKELPKDVAQVVVQKGFVPEFTEQAESGTDTDIGTDMPCKIPKFLDVIVNEPEVIESFHDFEFGVPPLPESDQITHIFEDNQTTCNSIFGDDDYHPQFTFFGSEEN